MGYNIYTLDITIMIFSFSLIFWSLFFMRIAQIGSALEWMTCWRGEEQGKGPAYDTSYSTFVEDRCNRERGTCYMSLRPDNKDVVLGCGLAGALDYKLPWSNRIWGTDVDGRIKKCCRSQRISKPEKVSCICNWDRCNAEPPWIGLDWADIPACDGSLESMADAAPFFDDSIKSTEEAASNDHAIILPSSSSSFSSIKWRANPIVNGFVIIAVSVVTAD